MELALAVEYAKQSFGIYPGFQERIHCGYDAFGAAEKRAILWFLKEPICPEKGG